jgi:hypothetical protein
LAIDRHISPVIKEELNEIVRTTNNNEQHQKVMGSIE